MQELPSQLDGMNELYSAITGYNQKHSERLRSVDPRMGSYQEHALDGASAVDLVVALYDGIIRFLYAAIAAVERGDADGRRAAVKRAWTLSFTCRRGCAWMSADGRRRSLSEFYAVDLCADFAGLAVGLEAEVRACHRLCKECARRMAAGGQGSGGQSGARRRVIAMLRAGG